MEDIASSDKVLVQTIGKTISKMTFFICCAVVSGMMINSCQVDEAIIIQCEESCGSMQGIKEVTGSKCECNSPVGHLPDPWVLPTN